MVPRFYLTKPPIVFTKKHHKHWPCALLYLIILWCLQHGFCSGVNVLCIANWSWQDNDWLPRNVFWPIRFYVTMETIVSIVTSNLVGQNQPVSSWLSNQFLYTIQYWSLCLVNGIDRRIFVMFGLRTLAKCEKNATDWSQQSKYLWNHGNNNPEIMTLQTPGICV